MTKGKYTPRGSASRRKNLLQPKRKMRLDIRGREIGEVAKDLLHMRGRDRWIFYNPKTKKFHFGEQWFTDHDIVHYNISLGLYEAKTSLEDIVRRKYAELKRPLDMLEVGCGEGVVLAKLRMNFKGRVNAEGIVLARPLPPKQARKTERLARNNIDLSHHFSPDWAMGWIPRIKKRGRRFHRRAKTITFHVGLAETHRYGKKYDLIFSYNSLPYAINLSQALINTLNHLRKSGEACLNLGKIGPLKEKQLSKFLEKHSIEMKGLNDKTFYFKKKTGKIIHYRPGLLSL